MKLLFFIFLLFIGEMASVETENHVKVLDWDVYNGLKQDASAPWIAIKIYAPWCGHCKKMTDDWIEVADRFKESKNVIVAEWDGDKDRDVLNKYQARGFPTIILENLKTGERIKYESKRTIDGFESWINENVN